eukprot:SAG11_NODE_2304_length_3547_cov_4.105278_2_plen_233_part_00
MSQTTTKNLAKLAAALPPNEALLAGVSTFRRICREKPDFCTRVANLLEERGFAAGELLYDPAEAETNSDPSIFFITAGTVLVADSEHDPNGSSRGPNEAVGVAHVLAPQATSALSAYRAVAGGEGAEAVRTMVLPKGLLFGVLAEYPGFKEQLVKRAADDMQELSCADFTQIAAIGSGALAHVKLVRHKVSGKYYALKIMEKFRVQSTGQVGHAPLHSGIGGESGQARLRAS